MTTFRLLLLTGFAALTLLARPALAQATTQVARGPAAPAPAPKYHYSFLWGLWSNHPKPVPGTHTPHKAVQVRAVARGQGAPRVATKPDSTYQNRSILGGAIQWTEKQSTPTR